MSIRILIVDDDTVKIGLIKDTILQTGLVNDTEIEYCAELDEAVKKLKRTRYDLVLLDIMLPARMGMSQIPNGGSMVLKCLTEMDVVKKPLCVIGLTAHDELLETCEQEFTDNLFCLIKYQSDSAGWRKQIKRKVKWLAESQKQLVEECTCAREYEYDFAIITAVDVEMRAVRALDFEWQEYQIPFDQDTYYIAEKEIENHQVKVVLARAKNMGMTAAATVTTKVISWFKPRYVSMIGITGGREGEVQLGDVILAKTSWDYGSGKWKQEEANEYAFLPDPNFITISSGLQSLFLKNYDSVLRNIRVEWNSQTRQNICVDNHLVVGPLASGAAVIQNDEILYRYIEPHHRKVLGVDMETYGVYYACQNAFLPAPEFFSIKAVSDFANSRKNDGYQEYCAFLSAHFLMELIRELMRYRR